VVLPFSGGAYLLRFLTELFMLITLALAWNLVGGLAGYVSFGSVAFFGLGAYTTGILVSREIAPFPVALALAGGVAMGFALLIGFPILRLRGHYFAIATLGVAEAVRQIISVMTDVTGGGAGLRVPLTMETVSERTNFFYYAMLGLLLVAVAISWVVIRSRLGYGLRAIRASEDAAATLGVDATRYKIVAFVLSAGLGGVAGGLYAPWQSYIDPPTVFSIDLSVQPVVLVLVGGVGTLWGPIVGGVAVLMVGEAIWGSFLQFHTAFLGIVLVLAVILLPGGLVSIVSARRGLVRLRPSALLATVRRYSV
jgi:branched-chain amino acid transport system permease protein